MVFVVADYESASLAQSEPLFFVLWGGEPGSQGFPEEFPGEVGPAI